MAGESLPKFDQAMLLWNAYTNAGSSYGLIATAGAALLLEHEGETDKQWDALLANNINGLTGFQAGACKGLARWIIKNRPKAPRAGGGAK